jgi:hypothetical protein
LALRDAPVTVRSRCLCEMTRHATAGLERVEVGTLTMHVRRAVPRSRLCRPRAAPESRLTLAAALARSSARAVDCRVGTMKASIPFRVGL